ncbi:MAG: hypothetical protein NW206_02850 [Hyphomonadaceae bacterium]|nr:hypothetical protein [Hyphomonadaceae bacterium]
MQPKTIPPGSMTMEQIRARMREIGARFEPGGILEREALDLVAEYMALENELARLTGSAGQ